MNFIMQEYGLNPTGAADLLILVMVFSGVFGFLYEAVFYYIDLGYLVKRGSTFGPWIPIYFFGGAMFLLLVFPFKAHPLAVFLLCTVTSGILEYATGFVLDRFFHVRLWDYNVEIWNFGNINGYICLRSVLFFGVSGLMLIYFVLPVIARIVKAVSPGVLHPICLVLAGLFVVDVVLYKIIKKK